MDIFYRSKMFVQQPVRAFAYYCPNRRFIRLFATWSFNDLFRLKRTILQNFGKVDRTADEIFDDHLDKFNRQETSANRLQEEFNNYIRSVKAAQTASKSLMDAICKTYEPKWVGYEALQAKTNVSDSLWQDFSHKLTDQVLVPLNTYTEQFPEIMKKVEKRNRKLTDYDDQRHTFQNLQANGDKREDDVTLTKEREQLEEARRKYETLNAELLDELPALYDSRILFLATNLQTLFATEQVFHIETAKIYSELEAIVDKLATELQRGSNTQREQTSKFIEMPSFTDEANPVESPVNQMDNATSNYQDQITTNDSSNANSLTSTSISSRHTSWLDSVTPPTTPTSAEYTNNVELNSPNAYTTATPSSSLAEANLQTSELATAESKGTAVPPAYIDSNTANKVERSGNAMESMNEINEMKYLANTTNNMEHLNDNANADTNDNAYDYDYENAIGDATTSDLPPGVLYRVEATYGYVKEEVDELSFEVGDIIYVIEYDDPDDEEEGWLMGQKEGTNDKGLFPANFTRPI